MSSVPCGRSIMPLCSIPARASKDGWAGPRAHISLPFYPKIYYFSGGTYTFPSATAPQDPRAFLGGGSQPDTFKKDCCS